MDIIGLFIFLSEGNNFIIMKFGCRNLEKQKQDGRILHFA
jgi:hypothetical protein